MGACAGFLTKHFSSDQQEETQDGVDELAAHAVHSEFRAKPSDVIRKAIEYTFPNVEGNKEAVQKIYDTSIAAAKQQFSTENLEYLTAEKELRDLQNKDDAAGLKKKMKEVYDALHSRLNLSGSGANVKRDWDAAAREGFNSLETNPKEGVWKQITDEIDSKFKSSLSSFQHSQAWRDAKITVAKESYYNELFDNVNEYYDDNGYYDELDHQLDLNNAIGYNGVYNGYNGYNDVQNIGHANSNFTLMNPVLLVLLIGVMVCVCILLGIISCFSGFVFGRYQSKIGDKNENEYEPINSAI